MTKAITQNCNCVSKPLDNVTTQTIEFYKLHETGEHTETPKRVTKVSPQQFQFYKLHESETGEHTETPE